MIKERIIGCFGLFGLFEDDALTAIFPFFFPRKQN